MIHAAIIRDVRYHMSTRAPEWWAALLMLAWGGWLERPIDSFGAAPSFAFMRQMASEEDWGAFLIALAAVRLAALLLNGTFRATRRWSPMVRSAAAGLSAAVWAFIATLTWGADAGSPITPLVAMIAAGEFILCLFVARQAGAAAQEPR